MNVALNVTDAIFNAVSAANNGDVLILADGGVYSNTQTLQVTRSITIKTADGAAAKANVAYTSGVSGYPSNMFSVNASLTIKYVKCNGKRGTNPIGSRWIHRGALEGKIEVDGCEVTQFNFLSDGGKCDTLIVTNSLFKGCLMNAGSWGGTWDFQGDAVKYIRIQNLRLREPKECPLAI